MFIFLVCFHFNRLYSVSLIHLLRYFMRKSIECFYFSIFHQLHYANSSIISTQGWFILCRVMWYFLQFYCMPTVTVYSNDFMCKTTVSVYSFLFIFSSIPIENVNVLSPIMKIHIYHVLKISI